MKEAFYNFWTKHPKTPLFPFAGTAIEPYKNTKNKEDRKVFQENGNLQSFESLLGKETEITLGSVIEYLNPVVIVDESHNAESDLSVAMLKVINPCFILDLTATPRNNSNIISFIDALELKKESMVKLPVIIYVTQKHFTGRNIKKYYQIAV